jgi:hypothetical protein
VFPNSTEYSTVPAPAPTLPTTKPSHTSDTHTPQHSARSVQRTRRRRRLRRAAVVVRKTINFPVAWAAPPSLVVSLYVPASDQASFSQETPLSTPSSASQGKKRPGQTRPPDKEDPVAQLSALAGWLSVAAIHLSPLFFPLVSDRLLPSPQRIRTWNPPRNP